MRRLAFVLCLLLPPPCLAHAFLDGATPRVGSELAAAPDAVTLHFTQGVEPAFSRIEVRSASGADVTAGPVSILPGDATRLTVKLQKIPAGSYSVVWHVTSVDTHATQGHFHFTVTR